MLEEITMSPTARPLVLLSTITVLPKAPAALELTLRTCCGATSSINVTPGLTIGKRSIASCVRGVN